MEQFLRGLAMDPDVSKSPAGTMTYAKNGVIKAGQVQSEPGFVSVDSTTYRIIGKVDAGDQTVIISTNGTNTEFGLFKDGNYTVVANDGAWAFKIGLREDLYVTGRAQRNYKDELVVTITNRDLPPLFFNCDDFVQPNDLADLYLQPVADVPVLTVALGQGGSLPPGAYYGMIALSKEDGTLTHWLTIDGPVIVGGTDLQNKSIQITATSVDSSYPLANLCIIHKDTNGQLNVYGLENVQVVNQQVRTTYNGSNFPMRYSTEEVLSLPLFYDKVRTIGLLGDSLYLCGPEIKEPPILQQYACLVQIGWKSEAAGPGTRTFAHDEVMAFYIQYIRRSGARTRAYVIPGLLPNATELQTDTEATAAGLTGEDAKNYRSNPVPRSFNASAATGQMCAWKNLTEVYPDNIYFDATSLGGQNYRLQPVCHHRTPSHRWCKENLYQTNANYGRSVLDKLSITVDNIVIPPGTDIIGYEILYARRDPSTSLVQGQGLAVCCQYLDPAKGGVRGVNMMANGFNWLSRLERQNPSEDKTLIPDRKEIRLLPFDTLFNRLQPSGSMLSAQLKLTHSGMKTEAFKEDGAIDGPNAPYAWLLDYTAHANVAAQAAASTQRVRKINEIKLLLNNTLLSPWNNLHLETAIACRLQTEYNLNINNDLLTPDANNGSVVADEIPVAEDTYLVSILLMKDDLYQSFANQVLVRAGMGTPGTQLVTSKGDVFISDYTQHAYGKLDAWDQDQGNSGRPERGIRVIRRYLCETVSNLAERYEIAGNSYSRFFPKSPISGANDGRENYFIQMHRTNDPNQFGYSNTFNSLADLIQSSIFAINTDPVNVFPFRLHRTGKLSRQNKFRSWRTLLPLDYYEMPRTFGPIIRAEGYGDKLLINMQRAFYVTVGNVSMQVENLSIALGSGDIFRIEPTELLPDSTGVGGLQDELAAVLTPMGYAWYDQEAAEAYVFSDKLRNISNLLYWFLRSLPKLVYSNPYYAEGIHMGWDPEHKRMFLTWRQQFPATAKDIEKDNPTLTPGQQYTYRGQLVQYVGTTTGCTTGVPGCTTPVITKTSPNITARNFEDSYIAVLGFNVTKDAQVSLSGNAEYYKVKTGTVGNEDTYVLYQKPAANNNYNSTVTITAINACGTVNTTHTVAITSVGAGGGTGAQGKYWPTVCYAVTQGGACGTAQGVWTDAAVTVLTTGVGVFLDRFLTTPVEDNLFLRDDLNFIWNLTALGVIGAPVLDVGNNQITC